MKKLTKEEGHHLIDCIHRDFLSYVLDRNYTRNMFKELGFSETEIFGLMELLGLELEEKERENMENLGIYI